MVSLIEVRRRYMMAIIPVWIGHAGIICIVLYYLLLGQTESVCVSILALSQVNQLVYMLSTERCFAEMRCYRRSHLIEDHDVVFGHLRSLNEIIN